MNISIFGAGYVGLVTGASLANLGHQVLCVDLDAQKIACLQQGEIPFYEPGLKELVFSNVQKGRLHFSTDTVNAVHHGEALFNCVGTPSMSNGSADLQFVFSVTELVAKHAQGYKVLINKSTVPPGTAARCTEVLRRSNPTTPIEVVSNPEFLKQGNAVYDFNHPDKIVVGATSVKAFDVMKKVYHGLLKMYSPLIETNWETAEMIKYANNTFLATKISFVNEIGNICSCVGADVTIVAKAIGMDQRIGPKFLNAGIGYGGSCFPKDVKALIQVGKGKGYVPKLLEEVDTLNERQKSIFIPQIVNILKRVGGNTVTLWGLSFKPKTSDLRGAPALVLIESLLEHGFTIKVHDPVAMADVRSVFGESIIYSPTIENSVKESSVIVLVTEWDEYRNVDLLNLGSLMRNKILLDGRNIYEPEMVREAGFEYYGVGRK